MFEVKILYLHIYLPQWFSFRATVNLIVQFLYIESLLIF